MHKQEAAQRMKGSEIMLEDYRFYSTFSDPTLIKIHSSVKYEVRRYVGSKWAAPAHRGKFATV